MPASWCSTACSHDRTQCRRDRTIAGASASMVAAVHVRAPRIGDEQDQAAAAPLFVRGLLAALPPCEANGTVMWNALNAPPGARPGDDAFWESDLTCAYCGERVSECRCYDERDEADDRYNREREEE